MRKILLLAGALLISISTLAEDWMSRLDGSTRVTELSIPGTHDTGTGNGFTEEWREKTAVYGQTQELSLAEQWKIGVRAFDMRPALAADGNGKHLHIYHGELKTQLSYEDGIRQLISLLKTHPTEFVFIIQQHENGGDKGDKDWNGTMRRFLNQKEISTNIISYSPTLTVSDMRGKIVLLSRTRYADIPIGAFVDKWGFDEDIESQTSALINGISEGGKKEWYRLFVQDYYETIGEKMPIKLECIRQMLYINKVEDALIINHTSGYCQKDATSNGYRENAAHTNNHLLKLLKHYKSHTGLIMMDYAGVDRSNGYKVSGKKLVRAVIKQNFR